MQKIKKLQYKEVRELISKAANKNEDTISFYEKIDGKLVDHTFRQLKEDVWALGTALLKRGFKDKHIVVIGENSYRWIISYLAIVGGVGVAIPLDKELYKEQIADLMIKGDATTVIFSDTFINDMKYVSKNCDKVKEFIKRAGTIILFCSVIIWFLLSFSWKLEYGVEIRDSILASIGNAISWIFYPILGTFSWEASVSAVQGLVAKEQVISSMNIIAGLSEEVEEGALLFKSSAFNFFTPASAYAYMVFNLFSAPCFGAIGAMRRELGTTRKMFKAIAFQTGLAWILASIVFNVGTFIGNL